MTQEAVEQAQPAEQTSKPDDRTSSFLGGAKGVFWLVVAALVGYFIPKLFSPEPDVLVTYETTDVTLPESVKKAVAAALASAAQKVNAGLGEALGELAEMAETKEVTDRELFESAISELKSLEGRFDEDAFSSQRWGVQEALYVLDHYSIHMQNTGDKDAEDVLLVVSGGKYARIARSGSVKETPIDERIDLGTMPPDEHIELLVWTQHIGTDAVSAYMHDGRAEVRHPERRNRQKPWTSPPVIVVLCIALLWLLLMLLGKVYSIGAQAGAAEAQSLLGADQDSTDQEQTEDHAAD